MGEFYFKNYFLSEEEIEKINKILVVTQKFVVMTH